MPLISYRGHIEEGGSPFIGVSAGSILKGGFLKVPFSVFVLVEQFNHRHPYQIRKKNNKNVKNGCQSLRRTLDLE